MPVAEERLTVGTRAVELGAIEIRKTVAEEQVSVPVTLRREEVTVREIDAGARPLRAGEDAFKEGTLTIALRGEKAVVAKQAIVTGEVVIDREQLTEERTVTDTVRKERVEVEQATTVQKQGRGTQESNTRKERHDG